MSTQEKHRRAIWLLALGQTLAWAAIYYLFAALMLRWETALDWSKTELSGAFALSIVVSALAAPVTGAIIDRGHGRLLLTLSAAAGGVLTAMLSQVETLTGFYLIWAGLGVAMAGCLYEPCFAYVTRLCGEEARAAITRITLVAGFASTLTFPLATTLADTHGWESAALVFAALIGLGAAPLFWVAGGLIESRADGEAPAPQPDRARNRQAVRQALGAPLFWLLALSFSAMAVNHGLIIAHLLAILDDRGVSTGLAVLAASTIGPMQVAGRVAMMTFGGGVSALTLTAISFGTVAIGAVALYASGAAPLLVWAFAIAQGAGYGLTSILRPVVAAELLGRDGFGAISGLLATPYLAASAAAPLIGAVLWSIGGADLAILFAFGAALAGLAAFAVAAAAAARVSKPDLVQSTFAKETVE